MANEEVGVLASVGPRLRALRGTTLTQLAEITGISVSTLSRLESGGRKPTLELLLPIARAHRCPSTSWSARPQPAIRASIPARSSGTA
jgi:transcriptional regulator with XRE-family HTH domain